MFSGQKFVFLLANMLSFVVLFPFQMWKSSLYNHFYDFRIAVSTKKDFVKRWLCFDRKMYEASQ
uniref:Uncharacterized protein n=1 Tax=Rhizophora mucronata TaxID=61149 RepID=A0A2P2N0K1_RHIMU